MLAGRTNASGGPRAARGPRVWGPCFNEAKIFQYDRCFQITLLSPAWAEPEQK